METLKRLPVGLAGAATEGLGVAGDFAQESQSAYSRAISALTGKDINIPRNEGLFGSLPTGQEIREKVTGPAARALGAESHLTPQNTVESALHQTARNLPFQLATGGSITPKSIAGNVSGSLGMTAAKEAGLPWWAQIGAGIAGERGYEGLYDKIKKNPSQVMNLRKLGDQAEKEAYAKEIELGSSIKVPAKDYSSKLSKYSDKIQNDSRFSTSDKKELEHAIGLYAGDIKNNAITASDLAQRRKELNSNISSSRGPVKEAYKFIRKEVNGMIDKTGKGNKDWHTALKTGDAIHQAKNWKSVVTNAIEEYPQLGKILKSPVMHALSGIGSGALFSNPIGAAVGGLAGAGAGKVAGKLEQVIAHVIHGEAPFKLLLRAGDELAKRNYPAAFRSYSKLEKEVERFERDQQKIDERQKSKVDKSRQGLVHL